MRNANRGTMSYTMVGAMLALSLTAAPPMAAQETRAGEQAKKRAEKAKNLKPYQPNKAQRIIDLIEARNPLTSRPIGFYPWLGGVYRGGWYGGGVGYRRPFRDTGVVDFHTGWTLRNYKVAAVHLALPDLAAHTVKITGDVQWFDAPGVAFYGVGPDSEDFRTNYGYSPTTIGSRIEVTPRRWFGVGGGLSYIGIDTSAGNPGLAAEGPSIEQQFDATSAPGLGLDPSYLRPTAFVQIDWRQAPGYTRRGGLYRIDYTYYDQVDGSGFTFGRTDAELRQYIPLVGENWILAFRARASFTDPKNGDEVPYFLMPDLGGRRDLRGFNGLRFRDQNALVLSGEIRWTPSNFLDAAVFYDAGTVAGRPSDLDWNEMKTDVGVGLRFHSFTTTALRIELAGSEEGLHFIFSLGQSF